MKNKKIVLGSIFVLIIGFLGLTSVYNSSKTEGLKKLQGNKGLAFVREHSPKFGKNSKKVTLVEFVDPSCEACALFHPLVTRVFKEYDNDIELVLRYLANHKNSDYVIKILEASRNQKKYKEVLDIIFDMQPIWKANNSSNPKLIWQYLNHVEGLDVNKLRADFEKLDISDMLLLDREDARTLDVRGTPTFFVNGKKLEKLRYQDLLDMVETEIYK